MFIIKSCPSINIGYGVYGKSNYSDPWDDYEEESDDDEEEQEDCEGE